MMQQVTLSIAMTLGIACCACSRAQLGIPKEAVAVTAPNGTDRAVVLNKPALDPPSQAIVVRRAGGGEDRLLTLDEDSQWCNELAWSSSGTRLAAVISDSTVWILDVRTRRILAKSETLAMTGGRVRNVSFNGDQFVQYDSCPGPADSCTRISMALP